MGIDYLSTSRVMVIDDKPDEALPIIEDLWQIGIGCVYQKGDKVEELPKKPINGIRLVFLDLRLDEGGDRKTALAKTISVLKTCINPHTIPLVVICWTRHEDDIEMFRKMAIADIPGLKTGFIESMPKPIKGNPSEWKGTLKRIKDILHTYQALEIIWQWENLIHHATTETSQTLAENAMEYSCDNNTNSHKWLNGMFALYQEIIRAELGKNIDVNYIPNALFRALNELVIDRINHSILIKPFSFIEKLIPQATPLLDANKIAKINQMILIEPVAKGEQGIKPGNIYIPLKDENSGCLYQKLEIKEKKLKENIIQKDKELNDRIIPVLIEISPMCDFTQNKRPVCTFITGLFIPYDYKGIQKGDHLYKIGPLQSPVNNETGFLVLCMRIIYGIHLYPGDIRNFPLGRLRSHILVDLQFKSAVYKARPGFVCLEAKK